MAKQRAEVRILLFSLLTLSYVTLWGSLGFGQA